MTKIRKQQRRKKFRVNVNRKRMRNNLRKLPTIECDEIKEAWEMKKSTRQNLEDMGLAYNPNKVLKIPSIKHEFVQSAKRKMSGEVMSSDDEEEAHKGPAPKIRVAEKLEAEARAPRERMFRLPNGQVNFITYFMDKYGEDYKAMARDRKNHYQLTWRQIRAKINTFKGIPEQYAEYLLKKGEIVLDDPVPLEETRRKIAEENLKKYSAPKKPKVTKKLWDIESLDGDELDEINEDDSMDRNKNEDNQNTRTERDDSLKKLKLFSDDETDNEEQTERKSKKAKLTSNGKIAQTNGATNTKTSRTSMKNSESQSLKEGAESVKQRKTAQKNCTTNGTIDTETSKTAIKSSKTESEKKIAGSVKQRKGTISLGKSLKKRQTLEKSLSSDSDSEDEELEGEENGTGFVNLSDMSEEELSEDDILDDGEFVTDSDDDSD